MAADVDDGKQKVGASDDEAVGDGVGASYEGLGETGDFHLAEVAGDVTDGGKGVVAGGVADGWRGEGLGDGQEAGADEGAVGGDVIEEGVGGASVAESKGADYLSVG